MPGNSAAISVRVQPVSGRRGAGQKRHDTRAPGHSPEYVDQSRSHLNTHVGGFDLAALRKEIAEHRAAAGQQKLRADSRLVIGGILTFGVEAQKRVNVLAAAEQDRLLEKVARAVEVVTGHKLLALDVHRDEAAIHAHFTLRGYAFDPATGKEAAWRKTPRDLKALQDAVASEVAHLGIERGYSKERRRLMGDKLSEVIHRSVKDLHESLPADLEKARAKVAAAVKMAERLQARQREAEAKAARAQADANAKAGAVETLQKRAITYETRARRAEEALAAARTALKQLEEFSPVPDPVTVTQALKDDRTFFQKLIQTPAPTRTIKVHSPKAVMDTIRRAEALRGQARQAQTQAERAAAQAQAREKAMWDYLSDRAKAWGIAEPGPGKKPEEGLLEALQHEVTIDQRYGVALVVMPDKVLIPPQKATAKQKAAALYTACKAQGWKKIEFYGLSEETAAQVRAMAKDDKVLDMISFREPKQQAALEKDRRPVRRQQELDRGPELEM